MSFISSLILYTWFGIIPVALIFNISSFLSLIIKSISIGNGKLFLIFKFTKPESTKTDLKLSKLLNEYSPPFWLLCIDGKINEEFSLISVGEVLSDFLEIPIKFSHDCINEDSINVTIGLHPGEVHLLENLRFYSGE